MLNIKNIKYIKVWEIIMSIFIIGLINIYFIHLNGLEGIFPIISIINNDGIWENLNCGGILKINDINILLLIIINLIFFIIFYNGYNNNIIEKGIDSLEYIFLLSFGLLGLNIIILSNDLIFIFISLELYSLSIYVLILLRISKNTSRISIIYLLINSLSSYIFLLGIALIYKETGSIILDEIYYILKNNNIGVTLLILSLLIKLGTVPFNFWVLRLYTSLENRILLYQIIIPKLVYIFLLYKLYNYLIPLTFENNYLFLILYIIAILSVLIGSIGGIFNTYFKSILTYSSIFNMGFILLGLSNNPFEGMENYFSFFEYLLIYSFNTLAIFLCFLLINPKSHFINPSENNLKNNNINYYSYYPFFTIFILISIFSFIGIPPLAGFYAKLNIFLNLLQSTNYILWEWSILTILILFIGTFISACFYLKFILYFFIKGEKLKSIKDDILISQTPLAISYYSSFFTIFLILYPFISNYLYPFYLLMVHNWMC